MVNIGAALTPDEEALVLKNVIKMIAMGGAPKNAVIEKLIELGHSESKVLAAMNELIGKGEIKIK